MTMKTVATEILQLTQSQEIKQRLISEIHRLTYERVSLPAYFKQCGKQPVNQWALKLMSVPDLAELYLWAVDQPTSRGTQYEYLIRQISYKLCQAITEEIVEDILNCHSPQQWEVKRSLLKGTAKQILTGQQYPTAEWLLSTYPEYVPKIMLTVGGLTYDICTISDLFKTVKTLSGLLLKDKTRLKWLVQHYPETSRYLMSLNSNPAMSLVHVLILRSLPDIPFDIVVNIPK